MHIYNNRYIRIFLYLVVDFLVKINLLLNILGIITFNQVYNLMHSIFHFALIFEHISTMLSVIWKPASRINWVISDFSRKLIIFIKKFIRICFNENSTGIFNDLSVFVSKTHLRAGYLRSIKKVREHYERSASVSY